MDLDEHIDTTVNINIACVRRTTFSPLKRPAMCCYRGLEVQSRNPTGGIGPADVYKGTFNSCRQGSSGRRLSPCIMSPHPTIPNEGTSQIDPDTGNSAPFLLQKFPFQLIFFTPLRIFRLVRTGKFVKSFLDKSPWSKSVVTVLQRVQWKLFHPLRSKSKLSKNLSRETCSCGTNLRFLSSLKLCNSTKNCQI